MNKLKIHHFIRDWEDIYNILFILILNNKIIGSSELYWYKDKPQYVMRSLYIDEGYRHNGYGDMLQQVREEYIIKEGGKWSYLWVHKKTWMRKWYARRGYQYFKKKKEDENNMWLRKKL